jgi:hypothetical protein
MPYVGIYNLSEFELTMSMAYIEADLTNRYIQRLSSQAAALIPFAKGNDWALRLYLDYRALNKGTVKTWYYVL